MTFYVQSPGEDKEPDSLPAPKRVPSPLRCAPSARETAVRLEGGWRPTCLHELACYLPPRTRLLLADLPSSISGAHLQRQWPCAIS
jgi:hypothetical protein